jgi:hypothetical protein
MLLLCLYSAVDAPVAVAVAVAVFIRAVDDVDSCDEEECNEHKDALFQYSMQEEAL